MVPRLALTCAFVAFVCPAMVFGQPPQPPQQLETDGVAPAHVALVDGAASLEREGRAENSPLNMPLLSGDRLRTADGRVEVLFADGSTLHLDMRSTIDVQSDDLVRLTEGRLRLNILGPARTVAYRIDSPAGSARITQPGEYRIALLRPSPLRAGGTDEIQLELAVVRGAAEVFTDQGSTPVRAGERAYASAGLAPSYAYAFNSATWDAFDRWSEARRDVRLGVSSQYLPSDMQAYAPLLDESGDWRYTESYGYAWYPRVGVDWRPYYYGRWDSYPRYGWTWIGADRFAWPTHHYGRWGFSAGVWFWIPSSRWAPAYVSWAYAPGYVSWCPLGFDNRPILSINFYRNGPGYYSPWRAWTAVSSAHFGGRGFYVNQRAVNWDRVGGGQRPRFENRPSAPGGSRDIAVPRNSTPIRWAGSNNVVPPGDSRALSRGSAASPRDNPRMPSSPARAESGTGVAVPRTDATPRYVNRGDEIVRSRTERPTPPPPTAREGQAVPRSPGGAETAPGRTDRRTAPEGPARPSRPDFGPIGGAQDRPYQPRGYAPRAAPGRAEPFDGAQGRPIDPSRASGSPRAESRDDGTQGRPTGDRPMAQPRTNEPRGGQNPSYQPQPPAQEVPPRSYERARPGSDARPTPSRQPERAAPAERAPSRGEGRQPPPERAAPAEKAAPRAGTAPPPTRRGGRGGGA